MEEKKYLKWYNKIGYGSGDIAGNVVYAFLTSFMMVYLTDSVGLAAGVVGTLIAVSKLFDGFTDIFFGSMIDKTHSKMGKAKPWMLYGYIGCAITLVCCFAVLHLLPTIFLSEQIQWMRCMKIWISLWKRAVRRIRMVNSLWMN